MGGREVGVFGEERNEEHADQVRRSQTSDGPDTGYQLGQRDLTQAREVSTAVRRVSASV